MVAREPRTMGRFGSTAQSLLSTSDVPARSGSTAADTTGALSQSDTLAPAHNGSIVWASHGQATVTFRNVVQAYHSTGVLSRLTVQAYWRTAVSAYRRTSVQTYWRTGVLKYGRTTENDSHCQQYKRTSVQAYHKLSLCYRLAKLIVQAYYALMRIGAYYGSVIPPYAHMPICPYVHIGIKRYRHMRQEA